MPCASHVQPLQNARARVVSAHAPMKQHHALDLVRVCLSGKHTHGGVRNTWACKAHVGRARHAQAEYARLMAARDTLSEGIAHVGRARHAQAEYARLMAARDTLSEGIVSLEAHLAEADKEAQAAALQVCLLVCMCVSACACGCACARMCAPAFTLHLIAPHLCTVQLCCMPAQ